MTDASAHLQQLARTIVAAHESIPTLRAALLTGSAALGISDYYSDIDLILYYDELPERFPLMETYPPIWSVGSAENGAVMRSHSIAGVECQLVHQTVDALDTQIRLVHDDLDIESPTQKALSGILDGLALYGEPWIAELKTRVAAYPDRLARKMIEAHLQFFPLWNACGWLSVRDCALWQTEMRHTAGKNLLGALCGVNRVYFTPFQLKHTAALCQKLTRAPENLAPRLQAALNGDLETLHALIEETLILIETHAPQIATEAARRQISRKWRPWDPDAVLGVGG